MLVKLRWSIVVCLGMLQVDAEGLSDLPPQMVYVLECKP